MYINEWRNKIYIRSFLMLFYGAPVTYFIYFYFVLLKKSFRYFEIIFRIIEITYRYINVI